MGIVKEMLEPQIADLEPVQMLQLHTTLRNSATNIKKDVSLLGKAV